MKYTSRRTHIYNKDIIGFISLLTTYLAFCVGLMTFFTNDLRAACVCNWSYCRPGGDGLYWISGAPHFGPCTSSIGLPNNFWGGQYGNVGACTNTSTCYQHDPGNETSGWNVNCSACPNGYGDGDGEPTFDECVISCSGGGGGGPGPGCTLGPEIPAESCEVATEGESTGLFAQYWGDGGPWTLKAQGVYPAPNYGTNGYLHGYEVNNWPTGWVDYNDIQLLPGACPNWLNLTIGGYVEIDVPGTYQARTNYNNIYLVLSINGVELANSSLSWGNNEFDGQFDRTITFPNDRPYPAWFPVFVYIVTNDYAPGFRFALNGASAGSQWYNGYQHIYKEHTSPCVIPTPPNSPPTCSISGPTSAVANYPISYSIGGTDVDSNMNRISVNYSPTSSESWSASPVDVNFSNTGAYSATVTVPGLLPGTYYIGCNAFDSATPVAACSFNPWCSEWLPNTTPSHTCSGWSDCGPNDYLTLTVSPYISPWFQASGGNVVAKGSISSTIPAVTAYSFDFIKDPVALMIYNGSLPSLGAGKVSNVEVSANTLITSKPEASFNLFYNTKLPEDVKTGLTKLTTSNSVATSSLINCNLVRGYRVCYYDGAYNPGSGALGNLTLTGDYIIPDPASPGSPTNRIILFVDNASVTINGSIRSQTKGRSSFLLISEGSPGATSEGIVIGATVGSTGTFADNIPDLEGVFYTDKSFVTSHAPTEDRNLHIRGSVIAGSFILGRDLGSGATGEKNDRYPAEYFEYGTEQVVAFPPFLRLRSTSWSEAAP